MDFAVTFLMYWIERSPEAQALRLSLAAMAALSGHPLLEALCQQCQDAKYRHHPSVGIALARAMSFTPLWD